MPRSLKNKFTLIVEFLKLKQGILFYIYNLFFPLIVPSVIFLILTLVLTGMKISFMLPQIFLYNIVVVSTNVGLLSKVSSDEDKFRDKNIGWSLVLFFFNVFFFIFSLIINFGD